jgi:CelD/BcsL family acetyltransferase involved in cellulose biosynthesis
MRSNISRQARKLFAQGVVEIVLADGAAAVSAWFDAYCDLDSRSWKRGTQSSIQRHPRRVGFYREVVAARAGLEPSFIGILLDNVLIAGLLAGSNSAAAPQRHGAWCLEMAYDESRAELGPGQLLLLVAMGEAIRRADSFLSYMQNFAYYKHRWGAESIPVVNVQLLRRASLHNLRASIGESVKWIRTKRAANAATAGAENEEAGSGEASGSGSGPASASGRGSGPGPASGNTEPRELPPAPDLARARQLAAEALAYVGPGICRLDRREGSRYLPFDIEL